MKFSLISLCLLQTLVITMSSHTHYIGITIMNLSEKELIIAKSRLIWGKWYYCAADQFTSVPGPDGKRIKPGEIGRICASGNQGSWSGTQGSFEIHEMTGEKRQSIELFQVHFAVAFSGSNAMDVQQVWDTERSDAYYYNLWRGNFFDNKLPNVLIEIYNTDEEKKRIADAAKAQSVANQASNFIENLPITLS